MGHEAPACSACGALWSVLIDGKCRPCTERPGRVPQIYDMHKAAQRLSPIPLGARRVDRSTRWGNPFTIGDESLGIVLNRDSACDKFEEYVTRLFAEEPHRLAILQEELRGRDLLCWCQHPAQPEPRPRCHAETLLRLANPPIEEPT